MLPGGPGRGADLGDFAEPFLGQGMMLAQGVEHPLCPGRESPLPVFEQLVGIRGKWFKIAGKEILSQSPGRSPCKDGS